MMPLVLELGIATAPSWTDAVLNKFELFLVDHAANERKASAMAVSLAVHYPDRSKLVQKMTDLAVEELNHYRQVIQLMQARHIEQQPDEKDAYVNALLKNAGKGTEQYFLDRLMMAAVVEARGAERFALVAEALQDIPLSTFYRKLALSEEKHHELFLDLAVTYFDEHLVALRMNEWLEIESNIIQSLPFTGRLH